MKWWMCVCVCMFLFRFSFGRMQFCTRFDLHFYWEVFILWNILRLICVCMCPAWPHSLSVLVYVSVFAIGDERCVRMSSTNKWLITINQIFNTLLQIDINVWWVCGSFIAFYAQSFVMCLCVSWGKGAILRQFVIFCCFLFVCFISNCTHFLHWLHW